MDNWLKSGSLKGKQSLTKSQVSVVSTDHSASSDVCQSNVSEPCVKKRKYDDNYIRFGFSYIGDKDCPRPQCVVCGDILANSSLKPSLLKRHLVTKHPTHVNKSADFFTRKANEWKNDLTTFASAANSDNENALEASYRVSYRIAKTAKPHSIAEDLVRPCINDVVQCMLGESFTKKVSMVPLSDNTINRRIKDMANYVENIILERVRASPSFAIQLDESTDVANLAILLLFVRYINGESVEEELLFCRPLKERTTGADIFKLTDEYFRENSIDWTRCVGICTDGAKSMTGCYAGFVAKAKSLAPKASWTHCCIHRQALVSKRMPDGLKSVLDDAVKIINFIKARPSNSRIFAVLCEEMGSIYKCLLSHTEVRWLSRGRSISRLYELKNEVYVFLTSHAFHKAKCMEDDIWLQTLAYLADIFSKINSLNLSLQGSNINVYIVQDRIESFIKKLNFWETCFNSNQTECFDTLHDYLVENQLSLDENVKNMVKEHLRGLGKTFREYFPAMSNNNNWIRNPFEDSTISESTLSVNEKEQLLEISTDFQLQKSYKSLSLIGFWLSLKEFAVLANKAITALLPFSSTYLCEKSFSSYAYLKNKYRNRLCAESDLRLYLTSVVPDFKALCRGKQAQPSH